ncbi:MAG TPA: hypothetical protein VM241_04550 [Candidatus Thermoplasmatota archaeon]|nr:hypothetical protein [Candidatus Thermoplasmatota archaeon]
MKLALALLATALLVPLALPPSAGQGAAPPSDDAVRLLEDKAADVKVAGGGSDQDPAGRWAAADLKALDVRETPEQVAFVLTVGNLAASPEAPIVESVQYGVGFRHLDQVYRVTLSHRVLVGPAQSYGYLEAYNPARKAYEQAGPYQEVAQDPAAGTLTFIVERDLLVDREGDAPHPEVPLTDWKVFSYGSGVFGSSSGGPGRGLCVSRATCVQPTPYAHDAMPDDGNGTLALTPRFGIAQAGHARLFSQTPTRASNGEATTIVYQVVALNRGPRNETFTLSSGGVPAGWAVRLPAARITVPANDSVTLPIVAAIPFTHEHGTYQKFLLEMQSQADPGSVGRIQLGVRYSNPPQPAGHHNVLWLHAAALDGQATTPLADALLYGSPGLYMNALDTDPLDARTDMPGYTCGNDLVPPQVHTCWSIPLRPQLELGLDFDLARQGKLSLPVKTTAPLQGAVLRGQIYYFAPGDGLRDSQALPVATLVPHAPVDVAPNSQGTLLEADVVATPDGDYVPYQKGSHLTLEVELVNLGAQFFSFSNDATSPAIQPGGILTDLPLNEYHDAVAQVFSSNATLQLVADGPQDRATNPGKTLLFNLTLQNDGDAGRFNLELTGTHVAWARILGGDQVRLGAGESAPIRIAIAVPTTADKGDTADLVLAATSASNLNVRSLARLFATVDTAKQYPDEAGLLAQATPAKKTPGLEALLVGPTLAALAAVARRRL